MNKILFLAITGGVAISLSSCQPYAVEKSNYNYISIQNDPKIIKGIDSSETPNEVCITSEKSWAPGEGESLLLDPIDNIYVGNVLSAESIANGSYMAIGDSITRVPYTVSVDQINLTIRQEKIQKPSLSNVREAVQKIINSPQHGTGTPKITVKAEEITSKDYLNIYLQGKYSGGSNHIAASFESLDDQSKKHFLIDITQVYYTISADDITPTGFFTKKPFNIDNTFPLYVHSVSYGRRIWIIYETSTSSKITKADLQAQFSFFGGSSSIDSHLMKQEDIDNSSLKVLMVGGNLNSIQYTPTTITDLSNLKKLIRSGLVFSDTTKGAPLSYTLKECYSGKNFMVVNAGTFKVRECSFKTGLDTTIAANTLTVFQNLCAVHTGVGDRNFNGDADITFSTKLAWDKNVIYLTIEAWWNEINGDRSQGHFFQKKEVARLPDGDNILTIKSGTSGDIGAGRRVLKNQVTGFGPADLQTSIFKSVGIYGDGPSNDDMGACEDGIHARINNIVLKDIELTYTKRKLK